MCSILIVNRGILVSPTLDFNPTLFVIPCRKKLGDYKLTMLQLLSLIKWFSSVFQSSMTIFRQKLLTKEDRVLTNG